MNCPKCGRQTVIIETRNTVYGIRRRRECFACGHKYSTAEIELKWCKKLIRLENLIKQYANYEGDEK